MTLRLMVGAAGLALLALGACDSATEEAAPIEEPTPPAGPAATDETGAFAQALNFSCEGGAALDIAMIDGDPPKALVRVDGGAPVELGLDPEATEGMTYKAGDTSVVFAGDGVMYASGGAPKPCSFVSRSLPPPTVDGVVTDIQGSQAGSTIDLKVGERFSVSLSGVPTAGYVWGVEALPAFLAKAGEAGGPTSSAQFLPGFAGGNHWEVLVFEATAAGQGELVLSQRRPWEDTSAPDDQRFKVTVRVQ